MKSSDFRYDGLMRQARYRFGRRFLAIASSAAVCTAAIGADPTVRGHEPADVSMSRLAQAEREPGEWFTGGRDLMQSYYSPLKRVSRHNVHRLGYAWSYDIDFDTAFEATPVVVDGIMYTSGNRGAVYSLDASTGQLQWEFQPDVDEKVLTKLCCTEVNRGVAVLDGKVYVGSIDGYLYALNSTDGSVAWKVDTLIDRTRGYSITGAPYIAKDLVIIGNSGAEFDARGYFTAYEAKSGRQAWRFFTVPGDPPKGFEHPELKIAAETWDPDSRWEFGLGGTVWDGMAYDPKLNLLYVGTGNGAPWNRKLRSPAGGDNLFLASILAINPDTGRLVWHYQTTPRETWDYTATQKLILADIHIDGRLRRVIMQAPKNGFFYVLDRESGQLLSADPYATVTWASHVDLASGRPVETPQADFFTEPRLIFPGPLGAHSWAPMSFSPKTGLVYIPVQDVGGLYQSGASSLRYEPGRSNTGVRVAVVGSDGTLSASDAAGFPPLDQMSKGQPDTVPRIHLKAWDPVRRRVAWQVDRTGPVVPGQPFLQRSSGAMSTGAGLVVQGGPDGVLRIFDARTGVELKAISIGTSILAAPMTYQIRDEQYFAVMAGVGPYDGYVDQKYGKKGRIIAFKLGGQDVPLRQPLASANAVRQAPSIEDYGTAEQVAIGSRAFARNCAVCHSNGKAPELARANLPSHAEFIDIVMHGARTSRGMGNFGAILTRAEADAIHAYVVNAAWTTYRQGAVSADTSDSSSR